MGTADATLGVGTAGAQPLCHPACLCWFLSHPVPQLLPWPGSWRPPNLLPCCAAWAVHSSEIPPISPPCGLSFDVIWEHPRVPIPCGTFVFDLAIRGSWNCFFSVTLPNVKNKFSLHFLMRKSMLCAAHPPSPAGETGLDSFGLMDVGAASGCLGLTELLLREREILEQEILRPSGGSRDALSCPPRGLQ